MIRNGGVIVRYRLAKEPSTTIENQIFPPTIGSSFAYVVDISGSMGASSGANGMTRQDRLDEALTNSINGLTTKQLFYINAFESGPHPMPTNALVKATQANKKTYIDWYLAEPKGGGTDPLDSMTAALDLKPAVIFFMTDGQFSTWPVELVINAKNSDRKIIIHTICLGEQFSEAFLKKIASENGGTYRFISDDAASVPSRPGGGGGAVARPPGPPIDPAIARTNFLGF